MTASIERKEDHKKTGQQSYDIGAANNTSRYSGKRLKGIGYEEETAKCNLS